MSDIALMQAALNARLGTGFSNAAEVDLIFRNLIGIAAPPDQVRYWSGAIEAGQYTQVSLAMVASQLAENLANIDLVGLQQSGLAYLDPTGAG